MGITANQESQHDSATGNRYDAFISYRRRDGAGIAQWLARRLRKSRLPRDVIKSLSPDFQAIHKRHPSVFLDTGYEKASANFLEEKIFPALDGSSRFIVIVTPAAFEASHFDGIERENWLCEEIAYFYKGNERLGRIRPIDVVIGPGEDGSRFPGRLAENPHWDWIDLRSFRWWKAWFNERNDAALSKLTAGLYDVSREFLPKLDAQERRRRTRNIAIGLVGVVLAIAAPSLTWLSVKLDREAESRALAVKSANELPGHPVDALDTAVKAIRKARTFEAMAALRAALLAAPLRTLTAGGDEPPKLAFVYDGRLLTGNKQGRVDEWNIDTGDHKGIDDQPRAGAIDAMATAANGKIVAWAQGRELFVWDPETRSTRTLEVPGRVERMSFDSRGTRLAVVFADENQDGDKQSISPHWLDLDAAQPVAVATAIEGADRIAWNPDSKRLAIGVTSGPTNLAFWDITTHRLLDPPRKPAQASALQEIAFPAENTFVATESDGAYHWNLARNQLTRLPHTVGPSDVPWRVSALAVDPTGRQFATFGDDRVVRLWDASEGRLRASLSPMSSAAGNVHFSQDGFFVLAHSNDGTARVWDTSTLAEISHLSQRPGPDPRDVAEGSVATPDLSTLAMTAAGSTVLIWRPPGLPRWRLNGFPGYGSAAFLGDDEEKVLVSKGESIVLIALPSGKVLENYAAPVFAEVEGIAAIDGIRASPKGSAVLLGRSCQLAAWSAPSTPPAIIAASNPASTDACIEDPEFIDEQHIRALVSGDERCWRRDRVGWVAVKGGCAGLGPDLLAKIGPYRFRKASDKNVIEERANSSPRYQLESTMPYGRVDPGGKYLVTSGAGASVKVIRLGDGRQVAELTGHNEGPVNTVFSPDGRWLLTAGYDGTMVLRQVGTWQRVASFYAKYGAGYLYPRFSPSGKRIAVFRSKGIDDRWGTSDGAVLVFECEVCVSDDDLISAAERRIESNTLAASPH